MAIQKKGALSAMNVFRLRPSCQCGDVHDTNTLASTIQNERIPKYGIPVSPDEGHDCRRVRRTFDGLRLNPCNFKRRGCSIVYSRWKRSVSGIFFAWKDKSRLMLDRNKRQAHCIRTSLMYLSAIHALALRMRAYTLGCTVTV